MTFAVNYVIFLHGSDESTLVEFIGKLESSGQATFFVDGNKASKRLTDIGEVVKDETKFRVICERKIRAALCCFVALCSRYGVAEKSEDMIIEFMGRYFDGQRLMLMLRPVMCHMFDLDLDMLLNIADTSNSTDHHVRHVMRLFLRGRFISIMLRLWRMMKAGVVGRIDTADNEAMNMYFNDIAKFMGVLNVAFSASNFAPYCKTHAPGERCRDGHRRQVEIYSQLCNLHGRSKPFCNCDRSLAVRS